MATSTSKMSMRLFGIPYQFRAEVDPRISSISSTIGRKFLTDIVMEEPVITIIPGKPKYLPGTSSSAKNTMAASLLSNASDGFDEIRQNLFKSGDEDIRYYDFSRAYTEYMQYVNILCRACATFLEIDYKLDGTSLKSYDWRNYRQNATSYKSTSGQLISTVLNSFSSAILGKSSSTQQMQYTTSSSGSTDDTVSNIVNDNSFVQFYVDPTSGSNESMSNATTESKLKEMMDSGSDLLKELSFVGYSGGMDVAALTGFADSSMSALSDYIGGLGNNGVTTALSRIFSVASNVVKGENVIMPDIYQSSTYDKSYTFNVHLKALYGNKYAYFLDVIVPLMHLLALGIPKQTSANTYGSPFLVKMDIPGTFTCNMGIVTSITINKDVSPKSWTIDGLPNEIDVSITVADLYSDLSMPPQSSPIMFVNNGSLIEYLANTCGLSVIKPNLKKKVEFTINTVANSITDIPNTVGAYMLEALDKTILNWTNLTW